MMAGKRTAHVYPCLPRSQRRRVEFFFGRYLSLDSSILEIGPAEGALGPYLVRVGFVGYRRLGPSPADLVGVLADWWQLGLTPSSIDLMVAFDTLSGTDELAICSELLRPGGYLFLVSPRPERERAARRLERLGWRRRPEGVPGAAVDLADARGLTLVERRSVGWTDQWARLRRPLEPGD